MKAECGRVRVCYLCLGTKLTQTKWVELLLPVNCITGSARLLARLFLNKLSNTINRKLSLSKFNSRKACRIQVIFIIYSAKIDRGMRLFILN